MRTIELTQRAARDDASAGGYWFDAFEAARDAMVILDDARCYVHANAAACRLLGVADQQLAGRRIDEFVPTPVGDGLDEGWAAFLHIGHDDGEYELVRDDGSRVAVEFTISANVAPGRHLGILRDVTERRVAALGLERQHRQLLDAQSVARIGSWEWDLAADTLECSEELERIFDAVPGSLTSVQRVRQCVHPDDCSGFDAVVQAALLSHEPFLWVGRSVQRDGTVRMIESRGRAIDDRDGTNMLGTAQDITERQHAEQALVAAHARAVAALRLKSQFMANMNHELRTPLNGLIGISDLLAATDLSADQRDFVGALQVSSTALLTVISDILDFSKIEAGTIALQNEPFALHALVENVCAVVAPGAAAKTIQLTQRIDEGLPAVVHGDANRVRQVLTNLANNAVKFTPEGQIAIRVGESRLRGGRPCIRFEVIDTGIGIEPQGLKSIFESFAQADGSTTRPYGGSGLGLTIARDLTTLMGGEIGVDSSPGHGSTFWFSVPAPHLRDPATMEPQSSLPARTCKTPSGVWSSWNSSGSTATERRLATRATATTWTKHAGTGGDVRAISGRASRSVGATVAYARLGAVELRPLGPSST